MATPPRDDDNDEGWRWLPARERSAVEEFAVQGRPARFLGGLALVLGVLLLPPCRRATGITPGETAAVWALFAAWFTLAHLLLYRRARSRDWAYRTLVCGNVLVGGAMALSLPVLARTPQTPLWLAFTLMACILGSSEVRGSIALWLFFALAPFATIPVFVQRGVGLRAALSGALVAAAGAAYGYWFLARRREYWRKDRRDREVARAARLFAGSERERDRLSRDLHDAVGTALSLVALYGALAEHHAEDPEQARRLAGTIRQSARDALDDLRGLMSSLPQRPTTVGALADELAAAAGRATGAAGAALTVEVEGGADVVVSGPLRTAVARICQEAIHNALRHGRARDIAVALGADRERVRIVVSDDGVGFDVSAARRRGGRGLGGMAERARELGGSWAVDSRPGAGARVRVELPMGAARPDAAAEPLDGADSAVVT